MFRSVPQYSVPKCQSKAKDLRGTHGPEWHSKELKWTTNGVSFGAKVRTTFCDDAIKQSKLVPSPTKYNPKQYRQR